MVQTDADIGITRLRQDIPTFVLPRKQIAAHDADGRSTYRVDRIMLS